MYLNADYIAPADLTGYVREALGDMQRNQFGLARFLPNRDIDDLDYRFTRGGEGLVEAATFRTYDAESPIGSRPGATRVTGELPPISRKIRFGEYDRLRQRQAGNDQIAQGLEGDATRMTRAVAARMELARGDALVNGSVTINENGVQATVSFGRSGGHSVAPSTPWSTTASATPLADLLSWKATYVATTGQQPAVTLLSEQALGYLLRNAEMRALAATTAGTPSIVAQESVQAVFQAHGLPRFETYDAQVRVDGATTRIIPADRVLFLPPAVDEDDWEGTDLGATLWGTTAESLEPGYGLQGDEAGIVAGVYRSEDPIALWTKAAAIGLPVMANPDLTLVADVF